MARFSRIVAPGCRQHVTQRGVRSMHVFHSEMDLREYPRSNARFHMGIAESDSLVTDRTLLGPVSDWEGFLRSAEEEGLCNFRQATRTGRPAGDGVFVATVEKLTVRNLSMGIPGRPRKHLV